MIKALRNKIFKNWNPLKFFNLVLLILACLINFVSLSFYFHYLLFFSFYHSAYLFLTAKPIVFSFSNYFTNCLSLSFNFTYSLSFSYFFTYCLSLSLSLFRNIFQIFSDTKNSKNNETGQDRLYLSYLENYKSIIEQ